IVFRILQTRIKPPGFAFGILYQCRQYSKSCRSLGFSVFMRLTPSTNSGHFYKKACDELLFH
ncbi:MAG: hypothetical protein MJE68_21970, partial [Proteobacteria bacterium]|nr:hypothetical protein [Pseudomonadota bacterium]